MKPQSQPVTNPARAFRSAQSSSPDDPGEVAELGRRGLPDAGAGVDLWVRRCCAMVVASVAADASYVHQRAFALRGGADGTSAVLWPLSVDGLLLLATVNLLKSDRGSLRRERLVVWLAFLFGIGVSLAANIAAAPALAWQPILVAGWPPVALLLSVELLTHRSRGTAPRPRESSPVSAELSRPRPIPVERESPSAKGGGERAGGDAAGQSAEPSSPRPVSRRANAERVMWSHFQQQRAQGRTPTGAELDRVAGTNNYGRAVLARWRRTGRIPVSP